VSTEEQAENPEGSIKNQEMRLRDYVKMKNQDQNFGEITEVFTDAGISAKDMNRPSLQRLLHKIRTKEINLVLVTELSRLTRSTKDFSLLWEFMSEHNCKFLSLRDNFDSTTPAGEMIMFTLANFAQFERRQTSERIANSFQARSKRGLWNGGVLPLGYDVDELKPGHLKIVPEEAEIVCEVFKTFLKEETIAQTAKSLNARNIKLPRKMRGSGCLRSSHFRIDNTHGILKNKAYIGIRVYKTKDGIKEAKAVWESIIEPVMFDRVQKILEKNYMRKKPSTINRYPYTLSGILFCKTCGDRLCGKSAHGKKEKIAYYEHAWSTKNQSGLSKKVFSCEPNRILAKKIEPVVWEDVKRALNDESYAKIIFEEARSKYQGHDLKKKELEKLKNKISSLQNQIEATTERITELPKGIDAKVFYTQILKLQEQKTLFEEQAGIIRKLIARIEVTPNGIVIHYYVGTTHFWRELGVDSRKINGHSKGAVPIESAAKLTKAHHNNLEGSTVTLNAASEFNFNADFTNKKGLVDLTKPASKPLLKYRSNNSFHKPFVEGSNSLTSGRG